MWVLFNVVMRIVSSLIGLLMFVNGGIFLCEGLGLGDPTSLIANNKLWAVYGAILALLGIGQIVWSNTRQR
jgi:hypothetical protein